MVRSCQPQRWLAISALIIAAACNSQTDSAQLPPSPDAVDTPASAPTPPPASPQEPESPAPAPLEPGTPPDPNPPPPAPDDVIPAAYQGKWDQSAAACARSSSEMRLNVGPGSLRFYEGSSRVLAVRHVNGGVDVDVEHTAEGTTERRTYRLATTGNQLTVTISGHAATRVRCD